MHPYRVIVVGGYGFFGRRLVQRLVRHSGLHIVVSGRSERSGQALVDALRPRALSELSYVALDTHAPSVERDLRNLAPDVVVHTAGPFVGRNYDVATACIACGAHYIDLADGREFVAGIGTLDPVARKAGLAVISGASSVPALSSAAADQLAQEFTTIHGIDIGISPGNRTERGLSTVQSILGYCGKPLPANGLQPTFGWSGTWRHAYPAPVGTRLLSPCDVPDLVLLPARYAGVPSVRFGAGLELSILHRGMNVMAMLTRLGLVPDWTVHATKLKRAADWFRNIGSDAGAMHVTMTGSLADAGVRTRSWHLVASGGDGPYVPTLAAAALIRKLKIGDGSLIGAKPCLGLLSLKDFVQESSGLHIDMKEAWV